MTSPKLSRPDPELDLFFERVVDVRRDLVWKAWTVPEHVKQWFTPAPWTTVDCEIDLHPGGIFRTVMRSLQGQERTNVCCYLEIVEPERLVWTTALQPGYRRADHPAGVGLAFTAVIGLEARGSATRYTALVMHKDEASRRQHDAFGFYEGWGKALDQLVALTHTM